ncbi:hypothetical protein AWH63_10735 [Marinobacter sp. C18]|uniref:hypothetical protein n=1 Tax=Marinobacter sp. C18 TaxID=1772288 RepID=UPI00094907FA|nr:hypothetical protein [Marinobacter sp. C18]OLF82006.1 hypothetical protein AWH63_10735 [Marinobacter sp. C18]
MRDSMTVAEQFERRHDHSGFGSRLTQILLMVAGLVFAIGGYIEGTVEHGLMLGAVLAAVGLLVSVAAWNKMQDQRRRDRFFDPRDHRD